jgi:hypothetical protein
MDIELTDAQYDFVSAPDKYPCFCGGFGSGKTHAAVMRAIALKLQYPKQNVAYYLPTYRLILDICFPRFSEVLTEMSLPYRLNISDKYAEIGSFGRVIFRTMDEPETIIGYEVADSLVDELDTLPTEKARNVWNKIIARNRQKKPDGAMNTVGVATTPEGFRFVYEKWRKNVKPGYRLIQAKTEQNRKNLPEDYISDLLANYPSNLISAYLDGEFVNLASGQIYTGFNREKNTTTETIKPNEALHVGMDFNVGKMAAVVNVLRDGKPHAVLEYTGVLDTPQMCDIIKSRHQGHAVLVYPDASGNSRRSNIASQSDIAILRAAGFQVCVNPANPAVKDRVLAMNKLFERGEYRVNPDTCPSFVEALEQQAYDKNGEPDKTSGHDHINDAAGYFVAYKFPIVKRSFQVQELRL